MQCSAVHNVCNSFVISRWCYDGGIIDWTTWSLVIWWWDGARLGGELVRMTLPPGESCYYIVIVDVIVEKESMAWLGLAWLGLPLMKWSGTELFEWSGAEFTTKQFLQWFFPWRRNWGGSLLDIIINICIMIELRVGTAGPLRLHPSPIHYDDKIISMMYDY